ncbi:MAG: PAS domain S-box protein [Vicinamibacterales bacterium]
MDPHEPGLSTRPADPALQAQLERQSLLLKATRAMVLAQQDEASLARVVFDTVAPSLGADVCFNYRFDASGRSLVLAAGFGIPADSWTGSQQLDVGQAFCGTVAATRHPLIANAGRIATDEKGAFVRAMGVHAYACHPLLARDGRLLGTFSLASTTRDTFDDADVEFFQTLCHFMSLAWERMRSDEERRRSDERFRLLVDSVRDYAVFMVDTRGQVIIWNSGAQALFGFAADEAIGSASARFYPESAVAAGLPDRAHAAAMANGSHEEEGWRVRKDGTRFWANAVTTAIRDPHGRLTGFAKVTRDLTERKKAQDAILAQEIFLDAIVNVVIDGIVTIDGRGRITTVNAATERIFGYTEEELVGRNVNVLMPEPYHSGHDGYIRRYAETGEKRIIGIGREVTGRRKDGTTFPVELSVAEFMVEGERFFAGVLRDITERRSVEEQLRQSQKMDAFGQLAGGVAHDFNNLLTVISGFSELILSSLPPDDPARELATAINDAGGRAAALTRQLLAFSRKTVLHPEVLDVNVVVRDTERMLRRLIGEDIVLATVLASHRLPITVDRGHLGQVLMNLAVNARDAMPKGGRLTIETTRVSRRDEDWSHPDMPPGDYVVIVITDTGHGMAAEVQSRIFEPFFTTKGPGQGTGLGLAVVHGIIKQSGGSVKVYSEVGVGTCFKLYFPLVAGDAGAKAKGQSVDVPRGSETVLLAEDEDGVRALAMMALQRQGYTVLAASGGEEALRIAAEHAGRISLLVTDVVMPHMDGRELASHLQASDPSLKVLFLSGYTDDAVVRHGILHQSVAYLQKPYSLVALARKVREVLDA